jgi:hypothetical protein
VAGVCSTINLHKDDANIASASRTQTTTMHERYHFVWRETLNLDYFDNFRCSSCPDYFAR